MCVKYKYTPFFTLIYVQIAQVKILRHIQQTEETEGLKGKEC